MLTEGVVGAKAAGWQRDHHRNATIIELEPVVDPSGCCVCAHSKISTAASLMLTA